MSTSCTTSSATFAVVSARAFYNLFDLIDLAYLTYQCYLIEWVSQEG